MTDEDAQLSIPDEPPFPGRSMTGAAKDLSSLFGDEAGADPGRTVVRPSRTDAGSVGDLASQVAELSNKITGLEFGLTDAVERIQAVDRHLATTFQGLQAIFDRMPEEPGSPEVGGALRELGEEVAGAFRSLGERLASLEERLTSPEPEPSRMARVEVTMRSALERLTVLEDRAEAMLSEARSGRRVLDELNGRVGLLGGVPQAVTGPGEAAVGGHEEPARGDEPPDEPALDALLGRVPEPEHPTSPEEAEEAAPEPPPAEPPIEFWSSSPGGSSQSAG